MVTNTFTKYAKYTVEELESYVADPNSCVQKLEWTNLVSVLPKYLANICEGVKACLTQKIGKYDRSVDGIILAFKNTKILNQLSAIRPNSVRIHVKVSSNFYVFRPVSGATIEGTIKYVSKNYLSAIIYRVFNVTIRLQRQKLQEVKQGRVIIFIVKSYDMKSDLPYIEGELISSPDEQLPKLDDHIVKTEKSPKKNTRIKAEPMDILGEVTEVKTNTETLTIPHRIRSKTEPATEESDSDEDEDADADANDVKQSMKAILDSLQKEMSDAVESASESIEQSEMSPSKAQDANKKPKRKKGEDSAVIKQEKKPKQTKLNGHTSKANGGKPSDTVEDSINAILSGIEREMSDITDSEYSSSKQDGLKVATPSRLEAENTDKKQKTKKVDKPSSAKKGSKRKSAKANGHSAGDGGDQHDDMEDSIQAILSGIEKEMSDATDSDRGNSRLHDATEEPFAKPSPSKKKKKKNSVDSLEKELFLKMAAEYSKQEASEPEETQKEPKKPSKKKKKKSKANEEDDFETSIMSSILKCAALVEESESKNSPSSSPAKRKAGKMSARKSVRFDSTITEASFNAFDSSELLEISQLQSPTLSSTLKGSS